MAVKKQTGAFPDMDELLGGSRMVAQSSAEPEARRESIDDPRGKLERTSLQLYTGQRDKVGAMAFFKRVNNYDIVADALDEYFERHQGDLAEALELQKTSNRLKRGRPRQK